MRHRPCICVTSQSESYAEESGQRALLAEVHRQLEAYYSDRGSYPRELSQLRITTFADGSMPATLQQFRYESDGTTFNLSCYGVASRQTIIIRPEPNPPCAATLILTLTLTRLLRQSQRKTGLPRRSF